MNNENQLTKLNICEHYYKGYCGKYDDGCFHQCKQKEVSEDCISREEVIRCATEDNYGVMEVAVSDIKLIPSVTPSRPQGEWKSVKASIYPYGYDVECSVCGHRMGSSFGYKFCPMCGAQMGGDKE